MISIATYTCNNLIKTIFTKVIKNNSHLRFTQISSILKCDHDQKSSSDVNNTSDKEQETISSEKNIKLKSIDRTRIIPVETSIKYMKSEAYKKTYGSYLVWEQYRRNHKGLFPPRKTRKTCIRKGVISTGNPCPICRDEYLTLDYRNLELLHQFISPQTGQVLSYTKTGLCQKKHLELVVAVERAWDYGLLIFDTPFREFDYSEYYKEGESDKSLIN